MGGRPDVVTEGQCEELPAVVTGVGGDAAQFLLIEQLVFIVQRRCVGQMDPGNCEDPATVKCSHRDRHEIPDWREQDRAVQGFRRRIIGASRRSRCDAWPGVRAWTVAPRASATWATRWALSPKPYSPSLPRAGNEARSSAR